MRQYEASAQLCVDGRQSSKQKNRKEITEYERLRDESRLISTLKVKHMKKQKNQRNRNKKKENRRENETNAQKEHNIEHNILRNTQRIEEKVTQHKTCQHSMDNIT